MILLKLILHVSSRLLSSIVLGCDTYYNLYHEIKYLNIYQLFLLICVLLIINIMYCTLKLNSMLGVCF